MTLQEFRYLIALADEGHFARAADACHVSQSTLSAQIKKLEDTLGVCLFDRSLRRIAKSPIASEVVAGARAIVQEADRLKTLARQSTDPMDRTLQLGVIPTVAPYLLPHVLGAVHEAFPKLRLLLREELTPSLVQQLQAGKLDAALLALPLLEDGFVSEALFEEPFVAAFPSGHALLKKRSLRSEDIPLEGLLLLDEGHCLRDQALSVCHATHGGADEETRATSLETLRHMVGLGIGHTLMPALAVPETDGGGVIYRAFAKPAPYRTLGFVWRKRSPVGYVLEQLSAVFRRAAPKRVRVLRPAETGAAG